MNLILISENTQKDFQYVIDKKFKEGYTIRYDTFKVTYIGKSEDINSFGQYVGSSHQFNYSIMADKDTKENPYQKYY